MHVDGVTVSMLEWLGCMAKGCVPVGSLRVHLRSIGTNIIANAIGADSETWTWLRELKMLVFLPRSTGAEEPGHLQKRG